MSHQQTSESDEKIQNLHLTILGFTMASLPFDPPHLLKGRRSAGFVDVPDCGDDVEKGWDGSRSPEKNESSASPSRSSLAGPTYLQRAQTLAGNIVIFEEEGKPPQAYWLQRKIAKSSHGVMRFGYRLRPNTKPEFKDSTEAWELAMDDSGKEPLVQICVMHSSVLEMSEDFKDVQSPIHELSALQMIAKHGSEQEGHVIGTNLVATCAQHIYTILPYHADGSLLQYCLSEGSLEEPVARFLFRQILKGLTTLQSTGLCHRNLSMESVELNGDHVDITRLGWSMRYNKNAPVDEDQPPPAPGGNNPQYIAPEYFGSLKGTWDGFAADLWACGLMLYSMVVSQEALFVAPIPEDKNFVDLCIKGKVGAQIERFGKARSQSIVLSDELVDLLTKMLKADPKDRLSLEEVMEHAWLTNEDVMSPKTWAEKKTQVEKESDKEGDKEGAKEEST